MGIAAGPLDALLREIRRGRVPDIHSLLILRHGYLVLEEYFEDWHADRPHTMQSVSKSVTSALVGIALGQKVFSSLDEKVLDFFPEDRLPEDPKLARDPRRRAMTLRDLLTMRSGTDYHERGPSSPHFQLNRLQSGWDRFYLARPMVTQPGTRFQYDSGAVILLSSMLKSRTGQHADRFAQQHLFDPLGIAADTVRWSRNEEGHPHTGGGLYLRPRDLARIGLLYLRRGKWVDRQILSPHWVRDSLARQVPLDMSHRPHTVGYGFWWWVLKGDSRHTESPDIYAALGFMGQYLFLVPQHDLMVVVTAGARGRDQSLPMDFFYKTILPAVSD